MSIPYFLDEPESNKGIIRQVIFPKFRGINKFLYQKFGQEMVFKEIANNPDEEIVEFEKFMKDPVVIQSVQAGDLSLITEIYHNLIIECISYLGMSEYLEFIPDLLAINWNPFIFAQNDKFAVEKLMQAVFDNYKTLVIVQALLLPFTPLFEPGLLSNPPVIEADENNSEHFKYLSYLDPTSPNAIFTKEEFAQFDDNRLALALSYAFYYCLKDIFSTCYLQITLPVPPPMIPPIINPLGLNILNEITLDLKTLPAKLTDPTELPGIIDGLNAAIAEQTIIAQANVNLAITPDFKTTRILKSSAEELKGKLKNIHNYDNNPDNIPVIQME
jgi:hypothetical protein